MPVRASGLFDGCSFAAPSDFIVREMQQALSTVTDHIHIPQEQHSKGHKRDSIFRLRPRKDMSRGLDESTGLSVRGAEARKDMRTFAGWPHPPPCKPDEGLGLASVVVEMAGNDGDATTGILGNRE